MLTPIFRFRSFVQILLMSLALIIPITSSTQSDMPGDITMRPILGVQKVLFIRVNYPDDSRIILTAQQAQVHADNLKSIFAVNSYGKLELEIDATPVLTMPQPTTFYSSLHNRLPFVRVRADAMKIAEDAGFHESDYDREIIFTTKVWQQVQTGVGGINLRTCYVIKNSPTLSAHELGHTYDWKHANFWWVTSANPIDTTGEVIDYGDKFDIMGDTFNFHHFNPWYKFRVGWITPEHILSVTESGSYTIHALENLPPSGASGNVFAALKIRRDPNTEYWVYYRSREDSVNIGALISRMEPTNRSQALLLDMTPGSKPNKNKDHEDAALVPGKTIRDQDAGIELTVLDKNSDSLRVQVVVSNNPIDTLPIIDIVNPKTGITVHGAIDYEATAYDPDVGEVNGAGIDTVTMVLSYSEGDETLLEGTPIIVALKQLTAPPYIFHVETDSLPDEVYRLIVIAKSQNSGVNKVLINHIIDNTGPSVSSSLKAVSGDVVHDFRLQQNYPNPFNPCTTIRYQLSKIRDVHLAIFNINGQLVRTLVQGQQTTGDYQVEWNGLDERGRQVGAGVYLVRLQVGNVKKTRKMVLAK